MNSRISLQLVILPSFMICPMAPPIGFTNMEVSVLSWKGCVRSVAE